jgi:hypothetical protein
VVGQKFPCLSAKSAPWDKLFYFEIIQSAIFRTKYYNVFRLDYSELILIFILTVNILFGFNLSVSVSCWLR